MQSFRLTLFAGILQIDRKSLPRHNFAASENYLAPTNKMEEVVQTAWKAVLTHISGPISITDNFFSVRPFVWILGRSSLMSYMSVGSHS